MVISLSLCKAQAKVRAIYTRLSQLSIRTAMLRPCRKRHAPEPGRITEAFSFFNEVVIGGAMNTGCNPESPGGRNNPAFLRLDSVPIIRKTSPSASILRPAQPAISKRLPLLIKLRTAEKKGEFLSGLLRASLIRENRETAVPGRENIWINGCKFDPNAFSSKLQVDPGLQIRGRSQSLHYYLSTVPIGSKNSGVKMEAGEKRLFRKPFSQKIISRNRESLSPLPWNQMKKQQSGKTAGQKA